MRNARSARTALENEAIGQAAEAAAKIVAGIGIGPGNAPTRRIVRKAPAIRRVPLGRIPAMRFLAARAALPRVTCMEWNADRPGFGLEPRSDPAFSSETHRDRTVH